MGVRTKKLSIPWSKNVKPRRWMAVLYIAILPFLLFVKPVAAQQGAPLVLELSASGPVTPAMAGYLERGIRLAEQRGAELLVFELDTPGGSLDLTQRMVVDILESDVPVVVYIYPRGAMAGSAGTVITLAGHVAAMSPGTAIGAASPISAEGQELGETAEAKAKNIMTALVRSLTERRPPEAIKLAEATIDSAQAISASEALEIGLIDFIASDLKDLLNQIDGFSVDLKGEERVLETSNATVEEVSTSFIEQLLAVLTNPNIVFLLLTIGVQAVLIELSSPGGWIAGVIGVVCLVLAIYGLGILPVNWFGLVFLAIAFVLFVLDIKAPTHGALTAAGIASLIVGGLILFNSPGVPSFQRVSVPLVVGTSIATGLIFLGLVGFALRAQRAPVRTGQESLVGRTGVVRTNLDPVGTVQLGSELWTASLEQGKAPLLTGERIRVVRVEGVRLVVRKVE
jgi:membrane-bound serine protease (ClpP class)